MANQEHPMSYQIITNDSPIPDLVLTNTDGNTYTIPVTLLEVFHSIYEYLLQQVAAEAPLTEILEDAHKDIDPTLGNPQECLCTVEGCTCYPNAS